MIDITLVPAEVKHIAQQTATWTEKIKAALQSGAAIDVATIIPDGEADRQALIAICNTAIATCQAIQATDYTGVLARLQRLGADLTAAIHGGDHSVTHYIRWFEIVFADVFGKA